MLGAVPNWQWAAIAGLLASSAFFAASETALTALGDARVGALIERGGRGSLLRIWQKHADRVLTTLLLGNTLANIALGALTALVAVGLGYDHGAIAATGITTLIVLVVAEVVPKAFAKRFSTASALMLVPFVALLYWALLPLTIPLAWFPRGLTRLLRLDGQTGPDPLASHELEYLIEKGGKSGALDQVKQELLSSLVQIARRMGAMSIFK